MSNDTTDKKIETTRRDMLLIAPEDITIITDKSHFLYDERVNLPLDKYMVANVKQCGVKTPIAVKRVDNQYIVVAGRQRVRWAQAANEELVKEGQAAMKVPCIVERGADDDLFAHMIFENEVRKDDPPMIKAQKAQAYLARGHSEAEGARVFGVSRGAFRNWLKLLDTSSDVQAAVASGEIKPAAAIVLAELPQEKQVEAIVEIKKTKSEKGDGKKSTAADAAHAAEKVTGGKTRLAKQTSQASKAPKRKQLRNALAAAVDMKPPSARLIGAVLAWVLGDSDAYKAEAEEISDDRKQVLVDIIAAGKVKMIKTVKAE